MTGPSIECRSEHSNQKRICKRAMPEKKPRSAPKAKSPAAPPARVSKRTPAKKTKAPAPPRARKAPAPRAQKTALLAQPSSVLMITPEVRPFAGAGGLADVAGALPAALARLGHHVTLVLPRYRGIETAGAEPERITLQLGDRRQDVAFITQALGERLTAVFVDAPELFDRRGLYGEEGREYPDNAWRFAVFSRAALEFARRAGERPTVIHAHDWQTGLVPVFQKMLFSDDPVVGGVPVVFSIHHLAFPGLFPPSMLPEVGLGWEVFDVQALEYWNQISYLKGGINFSERITTVGADTGEALTPELGYGFDGVLARRAEDLSGVLNGTDDNSWDASAREYVKVYGEAARRPSKLKAELQPSI